MSDVLLKKRFMCAAAALLVGAAIAIFALYCKLPDKNAHNIERVLVKAGTFMMGADNISGYVPHEVTIERDFYISKYPVTQAQYKAVTGVNPSINKGVNLPVETVSWDDAVAFCKKIGARLPTEAEWEFAARGGNKSKGYVFSGSNDPDEVAWHKGNSKAIRRAVGTKSPNELGIYDMSGNVWEWCNDLCQNYEGVQNADNMGPVNENDRIYRGGSWYSDAQHCRVASRYGGAQSIRIYYLGFRVVFDVK